MPIEMDIEYRGAAIEFAVRLGCWGFKINFANGDTYWKNDAGTTYDEARQYAQKLVDFVLE